MRRVGIEYFAKKRHDHTSFSNRAFRVAVEEKRAAKRAEREYKLNNDTDERH